MTAIIMSRGVESDNSLGVSSDWLDNASGSNIEHVAVSSVRAMTDSAR